MDVLKYIILLLLAFLCIGCRTKTIYVPTTQTVQTETWIEVRDTIVEYKLEYFRDTIATKDTVSFLFNQYTYSWATYMNGVLTHSLTSFPEKKLSVQIPLQTRFTIQKEKESYPVYIEKELKKWQLFLIIIGGLSLFGGVIFFVRSFVR